MKPLPSTSRLALAAAFALFGSNTFAAPLTWDNGAATGNWSASDLNWSGITPWNNAAPDDAIFGATGVGTVTISEAITAGTITFNAAGYTIDTSTFGLTLNTGITGAESADMIGTTALTLGANNSWSVAATKTLTANLEIGGAFGLNKTGGGALALSGANTYTGGTTVQAGSVIFGSATAPGTGALTFDNGGTSTATAVFSIAAIHANPITTAVGSTGANTIQTTNLTGTLALNGPVTINTGTTLKLDNSGNVLDIGTGVITGNGGLETSGTSTGNLIFRGANTYSGGTLLSGSSVHVPALGTTGPDGSPTDGPFGTGTLTINNATFRSTTTAATSIGNTVTLAGNLSAINVGSEKNLTFSGPVTLTGTRTITSSVGQTVGGTSLILSGVIDDGGNGYGLIKQGAGSLTLSGANTYGGNTTLSGGTVVISNAASFGAGDVLVTGASRIDAVFSNTYANDIDVGATLSLKAGLYTVQSAPGGTVTYSGVLSGSGDINVLNSNTGNNTTILDFTNGNNTFTGSVISAAGNANGADYFRFATIGDGGNFTFQKAGNRGGVIYNGASAVTFGTRQIAIGAGFGGGGVYGVNGNGVAQNSFENNASNAAHTVSFNSNLSVGAIASTSVFYFGGSNAGNNTFAGTIADAASTNTLGIGKIGAGKWILTGSNSFQGNTFIQQGTLSVNTIDVAANNQALGKGSLILFGYAGNSGTLEYTGSANAETDKQIVVGNLNNNNHGGGGGIVNNSVTGTLTFNNSIFNAISVPSLTFNITTVDRTLTLGGSNTGANTISGKIQDNVAGAAQVLLTKTGTGRWVLEGDNTYTGTTAIQGGVLVAGHVNAIAGGLAHGGSGAVISLTGSGILGLGAGDFTRLPSGASLTAGRIAFLDNGGFAAYGADRIVNFGGAGGIVAIGSTATSVIGNLNGKTLILGHATATHKVTVTNTLDFGGGSRTIQVDNGLAEIDAEISGVLQPQVGGTGGFTKTGAGTLVLSNANTYIGGTTVSAGTLTLNGSLADATMSILAGASVKCTATGTLTYNVDGLTADQVVNNGTINLNGLTVAVNATGAGLTETEYVLVDATGGGTISGTFAGVTGAPGYTLDYGTPNQVKLVMTGGGDPYDTWAGGPGLPFDGDANGDGVSNGLAWLLGAPDKDTNAVNLLPEVSENAGALVIDFTCLKAAGRGTATLLLQHSGDVGNDDDWVDVSVPDNATTVGTVVFTVPTTNPDSDLVDLRATIPVGEAIDGKLFGRLKAEKP